MCEENWLSGNPRAGFGTIVPMHQGDNTGMDFGARTAIMAPALDVEDGYHPSWRTLFHDIIVMVGMELHRRG